MSTVDMEIEYDDKNRDAAQARQYGTREGNGSHRHPSPPIWNRNFPTVLQHKERYLGGNTNGQTIKSFNLKQRETDMNEDGSMIGSKIDNSH